MSLSICILYFSGTGNTKLVAELFQNDLKTKGYTVDVFALDDVFRKKITVDVSTYDLVGFGYPVHAFNAPRLFFDAIKMLPDGAKKKVFVFKTAGDSLMNGGSTSMVRKALTEKGYDVFSEYMLVMPANVLLRFPDEFVKQLFNVAKKKVGRMSEEVLSGEQHLQHNSVFSRMCTAVFSGGESSGARFFGKNLTVSKSCTRCETCVKNCPTGNIHLKDGRIAFGLNCTLCMRCMYRCPSRAISPAWFRFFMFKDGYDPWAVINNPSIKDVYVSGSTKGYFRHYYPYLIEK